MKQQGPFDQLPKGWGFIIPALAGMASVMSLSVAVPRLQRALESGVITFPGRRPSYDVALADYPVEFWAAVIVYVGISGFLVGGFLWSLAEFRRARRHQRPNST